ncbi:uncharacterized protein [Venturia canescens]|uniref:uncharacterized protein n=1 Tax=Venturia canescens TaxID=32260 RepID=UPI001C9CF6AA|nr:uncharacterized protein LOC122412336 [Venturia canescens]
MTSEVVEKFINVTVNTIENIVKREPISIKILIQHDGTLIGESDPIKIEPDFRDPPIIHRIDFSTSFRIAVTDRRNIDSVVSSPLIVRVIESEGDAELKSISSAAGDSRKRETQKLGKKSSASSNRERKTIGICNVDMIPVILGEKNVAEKLIVEEPKQHTSSGGTSWLNLPVLTISLSQNDTNFLPPEWQVNCFSVTLESMHNLPASFTENCDYKAATMIYVDDEEIEVVLFDDGKFSKYRDVELTKRWNTLSKLEGRGRLSKYKIDSDYGNTNNPLKNIDLKSIVEKDSHRIEWNYMSRHILLDPGQNAMKSHLEKYRYWPLQLRITSNVTENGKTKSKIPKSQFYQCYVDLSELLYPGRTQTRTVAQLYSFSTTEMMEKTGFNKVLFADANTVEPKSREKKGKLDTRSSLTNSSWMTRTLFFLNQINLSSMDSVLMSSVPLTNESSEPVFVIMQFELLNAILPSTNGNLTYDLRDLIGAPEKLLPYPYTGDLAEEQYNNCIKKLAETIIESYRDEIDRFTQYLYDTGTYVSIQTSLKQKIVRLLDQKFKMQSGTWDSEECQNVVANAYLYFVEQMHLALNSESEYECENNTKNSTDNVCFYAEEFYEMGNIARAKNIYLSLIAKNRRDPETWLKYAIFSKKINDEEKALSCCREAISVDRRHKFALLLYGVLLAETQDYKSSEIFLKAATQFYPRSVEAWGILHLFFLRTEYFPGVDLSIRVAQQCLLDQDCDRIPLDCFDTEPLAWSTIHCSKNRIYLILTVFLLKLNLFDFAGIALAEELLLSGRSTSWLYFMAVHHYLLGRYDDALTHLREAQHNHGMDYSISALMGHCYFKNENSELAIECYEFASTLFNRPLDIHLVNLRLADYLLQAEEYSRGKKLFLNVCKTSPTSSSWLGLGIACYELNEFENAEVALTEANRRDHINPDIWGYLCLLNICLQRYDEFAECYRQAVKNDLQNEKLWVRITNAMESSELSSPMLLTTKLTEVEKSSENVTSIVE